MTRQEQWYYRKSPLWREAVKKAVGKKYLKTPFCAIPDSEQAPNIGKAMIRRTNPNKRESGQSVIDEVWYPRIFVGENWRPVVQIEDQHEVSGYEGA
jgi:hypothetical protein